MLPVSRTFRPKFRLESKSTIYNSPLNACLSKQILPLILCLKVHTYLFKKQNRTINTITHRVYLFFYFWLSWVFVVVLGLSLVVAIGGYSLLRCAGFSLRWLLLLWSMGSRRVGFSSCSTRVVEHRPQQLWRTGLVALQHVGSSRTRARTHVPCIGRRILNHCATKEVPQRV